MKKTCFISIIMTILVLLSSLISCDDLGVLDSQTESSQNSTETEGGENISQSEAENDPEKGTGIFVGTDNVSETVEETYDQTDTYETSTQSNTEKNTEVVIDEDPDVKVEIILQKKDNTSIYDDFMTEFKDFVKAGNPWSWAIIRIDSYDELVSLTNMMYEQPKANIVDVSEVYFDENCLIALYINESSGSIWHDITSFSIKNENGKNELVMNIKRYSPTTQTDDIKPWLLTAGVKKSDIASVEAYSVDFDEIVIDVTDPDVMLEGSYHIRLDSDGEGAQYLSSMVEPEIYADENTFIRIDSISEYKAFSEKLKREGDRVDLTNTDGNISYSDLSAKCDEAFFEEYSLIMTYVKVDSDSLIQRLRYGILHRNEKTNKNTVIFVIEPTYPYQWAQNAEGWLFCSAISKKHTENTLYYDVNFAD